MTPGPQLHNMAGITLVELLVVIALIAILAGVATPTISDWNCRQETEGDFLNLAGGISYLQALAKDRNRTTLLRSSRSGTKVTFSYYQARGVGRKEDCWGRSYSASRWERINGSASVDGTLLAGGGGVCFHADGSVNQGLTKQWTVGTVCGPQKKIAQYKIIVHGTTGFLEKTKYNRLTKRHEEI